MILSIHSPTCLNRPLPEMIAHIIDDNYERIKSDLVSRGLTVDRLIDDVLDHVCCMVEEYMIQGIDFESSYQRVLDHIGDKRLTEIQHQTILNLDKNYQRMKKFTYLFGLSSAIITIIGAICKRMHWPGGGVLIPVGMALVILVFLPLYFITKSREQTEKKNPVYAIVGYLTLGLLLAGATFKNMHWPGANGLTMVGAGFLIIGFVPLYVVNVFQRSGREKITLPYLVMLLVGLSIVILFSNINMSKNLLDIYREAAVANENRVEELQVRTAKLLDVAEDSTYAQLLPVISKIHGQSRDLQVMVNEMQEGMKSFVRQPGVPIEELKWVDIRGSGREAIIDNGHGYNFVLEASKYKAMLNELILDPAVRNQIEDHLEFTSKVWYHEFGPSDIVEAPLMKNYFKNTDASKGIALSEYVAIDYLLHQ